MSDDKTTMSPQQRKQAEAEAARIKRVAEKTTTGRQLGGTYFGQEPDEGMAPAKKSADNDS